jgi:hypothetical protein
LGAKRFINYRSFRPILGLVPVYDAPGSQQWAVWALAKWVLCSSMDTKFYKFFLKMP